MFSMDRANSIKINLNGVVKMLMIYLMWRSLVRKVLVIDL